MTGKGMRACCDSLAQNYAPHVKGCQSLLHRAFATTPPLDQATLEAIDNGHELLEYLEACEQDYILVGGRKFHTTDLRTILDALSPSPRCREAATQPGQPASKEMIVEEKKTETTTTTTTDPKPNPGQNPAPQQAPSQEPSRPNNSPAR